ncbi:MAG: leucine-rich repeat domain-containing protein [Myxococcota bacterium]
MSTRDARTVLLVWVGLLCSLACHPGADPTSVQPPMPPPAQPDACTPLSPGPVLYLDAAVLTLEGVASFRGQRVSLWTSDLNPSTLTPFTKALRCNLVGLDVSTLQFSNGTLDLSGLTRLETLNIEHATLRTLAVEGELPALRSVQAWSSKVNVPEGLSDISALIHAPGLIHLFVDGTQITDISALSGHKNLRHLDLSNTDVSDLTPLQKVTSLRALNAAYTQVESLEPLKGLQRLHTLFLDHTPISSLEPLHNLKELRVLSLAATGTTDLGPLSGLHLVQLSIAGTPIVDLSPLDNMDSLEHLFVEDTQVPPDEVARLQRLLPHMQVLHSSATDGGIVQLK